MTGIFCAIDTPDLSQAKTLATSLSGHVEGLKLGLEFFVAHGSQGVADIRDVIEKETKLFLDLKLHDIPNTVAGAVRAATSCGIDFLTVHTSGGPDMMKAAVEAAEQAAADTGYDAPLILGVTVLTALDDDDLKAVGQQGPAAAQVLRLANCARDAGLKGLVCSPHEVEALRSALGGDMVLVVPGIRPADSGGDDQKRTMTPAEAATAGANWLVIGRPITKADNPAKMAESIRDTLKQAA